MRMPCGSCTAIQYCCGILCFRLDSLLQKIYGGSCVQKMGALACGGWEDGELLRLGEGGSCVRRIWGLLHRLPSHMAHWRLHDIEQYDPPSPCTSS